MCNEFQHSAGKTSLVLTHLFVYRKCYRPRYYRTSISHHTMWQHISWKPDVPLPKQNKVDGYWGGVPATTPITTKGKLILIHLCTRTALYLRWKLLENVKLSNTSAYTSTCQNVLKYTRHCITVTEHMMAMVVQDMVQCCFGTQNCFSFCSKRWGQILSEFVPLGCSLVLVFF